MHSSYFLAPCCLALAAWTAHATQPAASTQAEAVAYFEKHVRPVFVEKCQSCHGPKKQQGSLRVDSRQALLEGGDSGPSLVAGKPDESLLVKAVRRQGKLKMPAREADKLSPAETEAIATWVKMGAPWPAEKAPVVVASIAEVRKSHWSFRPVVKGTPPTTRDGSWPINPVDRFILAKLEAKGLTPSARADRRTLIRRLSFDLLGIPPTPEEVEAFVADGRPDAYERLVETMLASSAYGERWGRHWLDVARYADTKGYVFVEERRYPYAFTYRDYVIDALNADLPYDEFVLHQLAADRLFPGPDRRPLAAMGFLTLGRRFLNNTHDIIDDRIDVVTRGLMGLTVSCARCHDHKFDPIPTRDYYSLHGVFASSNEPAELPLLTPADPTAPPTPFEIELRKRQGEVDAYLNKLRADLKLAANTPLDQLKGKLDRAQRDRHTALKRKVDEWRATAKGGPLRAMAMLDNATPTTPHVLVRGNPGNHGPAVPRQFLEILAPDRKAFTIGSGRLELARAIASKDNPLTARVMVNRVWMHHFGAAIVRTPGDFGTRGEAPTHPELLDWLAATFVEDGWSVKRLHRLLLLSATYRQSSAEVPKLGEIDPENRLVSRMNRRRLEFEPLRDGLLAVADRLDTTHGGPAVDITAKPYSSRRSVYAFIERQNLPGVFRSFDLASPDVSTPQRHATTVPQQSLFLMNHPFVHDLARGVIARPDVAATKGHRERIDRLHRLLYGRPADAEEVTLGETFVKEAGQTNKLSAWEQYAQVLMLSNEFAFVD